MDREIYMYHDKVNNTYIPTSMEQIEAVCQELNYKLIDEDVTNYDAITTVAKYSGVKLKNSISLLALKCYTLAWVDDFEPLRIVPSFKRNGNMTIVTLRYTFD